MHSPCQLIKPDNHVVEDTPEAEESTQETDVTDPPTPQEITCTFTVPQTEEILSPRASNATTAHKPPTPVQPRRSTRTNCGVCPD